MILNITGSKTSAQTQTVAIPRRGGALCAVVAVEAYLAATGISYGSLFRAISKSGLLLDRRLDAGSVGHILARRMVATTPVRAHALRAGFITLAADRGTPEHVIQRTSRHRSSDVLRTYIRSGDPFAGHPAQPTVRVNPIEFS
jgi:integrase